MNPLFKSQELSDSCDSRNRLLRVVDILEEEEEEHDCDGAEDFGMADVGERLQDGSSTIQCLSPRRIIARWVASFRRPKERREAKEIEREKERTESGGRWTCTRCSRNGLDDGISSSSSLESVGPGRSRKDTSFNLGVGCSLLYLVLASKNELSKMVDLRKQMEILLQDVRAELQRKRDLFEPFQTNTDVACSSIDFQEGPCSTTQLSYQQDFSSQILSDSQSTVPNHSMKSCLHEQDKHKEGIDELEAEFEAELERLQLHLEVESSSKRREQIRIKTAKNTDSTISCCMSSGEVIDPQELDTDGQHGVPPVELERRLHELLEARQQERIKELEGALECAKQEITEKESEISWWKETAKVIFQHVPAHSRLRLASQHDRLIW